jgi:hypothetical protein
MTEYTQTAVDPQGLQRPRWMPNAPLVYTPPSRTVLQTTPSTHHAGSAFDVLRQQISGSLQTLGHSERPRRLPQADPYEPSLERQTLVFISFLASDFGMKQGHRLEQFERALENSLTSAAVAAPKIVAAFVGRVETLIGDSANVILVNEQTGERLESRCDAEVLLENSIGAGDEFRCEVVRSKGATATRLSRMPPKTLSKERVQQIRASFKDRWQF